MIIDPNVRLKDIFGKDLKDTSSPKEISVVTLRRVMVNAILDPNDKVDGEEKMRRYQLALDIQKADADLDISVDDVKLIKDKIAELYPPLVVGQAWSILDPRPKKKGKNDGE